MGYLEKARVDARMVREKKDERARFEGVDEGSGSNEKAREMRA